MMGFTPGIAQLPASDEAQLQKIDELATLSSPTSGSVAALLNTVNSNLGTTSDAASATGTANAKLAAVINRIGAGNPLIFVSANSSTTSAVTLCNISATSGILEGFSWDIDRYNDCAPIVTLIKDGSTVINNQSLYAIIAGGGSVTGFTLPLHLEFASSLQITFLSSQAYSVVLAASVRTGV